MAHTAPAPFLLEWITPGRSMWHGPRQQGVKTIYLTYDDGPNPTATPALLDVLAKEAVHATFFVIPAHMTPETGAIVRRAHQDGHGVALHSHTRSLMVKRPSDLAALLDRQSAEIAQLSGKPPCSLFRPHAGWRSGMMYSGLRRSGRTLAGWSFGMWDWDWWRKPRPEQLADRLARKASDGDIVVMHDGHHIDPRADRQRTVDATAALIPKLKARGFQFKSLCPN